MRIAPHPSGKGKLGRQHRLELTCARCARCCYPAELIANCDAKLAAAVPGIDEILEGNVGLLQANPRAGMRLTASAGTLLPVGGAPLAWQRRRESQQGACRHLKNANGQRQPSGAQHSDWRHNPCCPRCTGSHNCFPSVCVAVDAILAQLGGGAPQPQYRARARAHVVFAKKRTQGSTKSGCWPGAAPMGLPTPMLKEWDINSGGLLPAPPAAWQPHAG